MPNRTDFNHFDYNPTDIHIERSLFNMDHSVKFSCNVGDVVPFDIFECLPGDSWSIDTAKVVRLQPLVTPIMDEVIQDIYYFFVPFRLIWNHWKEFCGENNQGPWAPSVSYQIPTIVPPENGWDVGSIADYFGVPPKVEGDPINALPFRAYALICDQWFRSESVMNPVHVYVDDIQRIGSNGNDQVLDIELGGKPFIACKFFDYFTSGLPSPQRGNPVDVFPSDTYTPVISLTNDFINNNGLKHPYAVGNYPRSGIDYPIRLVYTSSNVSNEAFKSSTGKSNVITSAMHLRGSSETTTDTAAGYLWFDNLYARLDDTKFNINDLRTAFAVQRYLEKSARYGGRYIEFVKGFFGVESPDARLQRTEYIGGSRLSLNINSVEQTSATTETSTPLGNVAGMSVTGDYNSDFTYSCTEHGYIIGVSVLRYHHSYQQGINRLWLRRNFTDFYIPTFAFLGEQEISMNELYYQDTGDDPEVFAYQERWSEYRYLPNRIAGEMRSISDISLDVWHLGDFYNSMPTLSPEWIREDKTMLDRCLAVTSDIANQAICDFYIKAKAARPLPMYSIPGMIDHY